MHRDTNEALALPAWAQRRPLGRWIADARSIEQLRLSRGALRLRDRHLESLDGTAIEEEDQRELLETLRSFLLGETEAPVAFRPHQITQSIVGRIDMRLAELASMSRQERPQHKWGWSARLVRRWKRVAV